MGLDDWLECAADPHRPGCEILRRRAPLDWLGPALSEKIRRNGGIKDPSSWREPESSRGPVAERTKREGGEPSRFGAPVQPARLETGGSRAAPRGLKGSVGLSWMLAQRRRRLTANYAILPIRGVIFEFLHPPAVGPVVHRSSPIRMQP